MQFYKILKNWTSSLSGVIFSNHSKSFVNKIDTFDEIILFGSAFPFRVF